MTMDCKPERETMDRDNGEAITGVPQQRQVPTGRRRHGVPKTALKLQGELRVWAGARSAARPFRVCSRARAQITTNTLTRLHQQRTAQASKTSTPGQAHGITHLTLPLKYL